MRHALSRILEYWHTRRTMIMNKQETEDMTDMYQLTAFFNNFHLAAAANQNVTKDMLRHSISQEDYDALAEVEQSKIRGYFDKRERLTKILDQQVVDLFKFTHSVGGINPYPKPKFKLKSEEAADAFFRKRMNVDEVEVYNPGVRIPHPQGFKMCIKKSDIDHPESGYGVFVDGVVVPGTVIGFYAGLIYFPRTITKEVAQGNEYIYQRYDASLIDGWGWESLNDQTVHDALKLQHAGQSSEQQEAVKRFRNPFAIAQYINHPPAGKKNNVVMFSYDFKDDFPIEYIPYIPNGYGSAVPLVARRHNCIMRSAVCVASRAIVDEELFFNYRYDPASPLVPPWYHHVDDFRARRRWGRRSLFH